MGIGQEPSSSDPEIEKLGDTQSEPEEETKVKSIDEKELELELAGKPWPVASDSVVIQTSLLLLSYCYIVAYNILLDSPFAMPM